LPHGPGLGISIRRIFLSIEMSPQTAETKSLNARLAKRLAQLRGAGELSLDELAKRSGISRATLSRLERNKTSPTAAMLGRLCAVYGQTTSQLMTDSEADSPQHIRAADQTLWVDPETGFKRRIVSPPGYGLRGEIVEGSLPAGADVAYARPPLPGLEHHLLMLAGSLEFSLDKSSHLLNAGDCFRYRLSGASRFRCVGRRAARYLVAIWHPSSS
jgi:transcriptional regulator with XRE-family HTH domain